MAAKLVMAEEAEKDLDEAYAWYEARRVGLGEEFLSSVDACIQAICRLPKLSYSRTIAAPLYADSHTPSFTNMTTRR